MIKPIDILIPVSMVKDPIAFSKAMTHIELYIKNGKVYAVVKKELEELMKLSNEYFDVRHNDYLNAAKEK